MDTDEDFDFYLYVKVLRQIDASQVLGIFGIVSLSLKEDSLSLDNSIYMYKL